MKQQPSSVVSGEVKEDHFNAIVSTKNVSVDPS